VPSCLCKFAQVSHVQREVKAGRFFVTCPKAHFRHTTSSCFPDDSMSSQVFLPLGGKLTENDVNTLDFYTVPVWRRQDVGP
jgi:hypothetical protein